MTICCFECFSKRCDALILIHNDVKDSKVFRLLETTHFNNRFLIAEPHLVDSNYCHLILINIPILIDKHMPSNVFDLQNKFDIESSTGVRERPNNYKTLAIIEN